MAGHGWDGGPGHPPDNLYGGGHSIQKLVLKDKNEWEHPVKEFHRSWPTASTRP